MFYILSRFAPWLTWPGTYLMLLLVVALRSKSPKARRALLALWSVVLLTMSVPRVSIESAAAWVPTASAKLDSTKHWTYGFVPGGMSNYDTTMHRVEYGEAVDRVTECVDLMKRGLIDTMVISGDGAPNLGGEVFWQHMETVFGIERSRILVEHRALNTMQNFTYTQEMMGRERLNGHTLVINSGLYMRRTMLCARLSGWEADYYSVDYVSETPKGWTYWVPQPQTIDNWTKLLHELVGYVAYVVVYGN